MSIPTLQFKRLPENPDLPLPAYETAAAAAFDLRACIPAEAPLTLTPGQRALIPTGYAVAIPEGYEMQVRARSGLALKNGIGLVNGVGTIDADYRGPLGVILINHGQENFTVTRGDRIAQAVIATAPQVRVAEVTELSETSRGTGGFGSTGTT